MFPYIIALMIVLVFISPSFIVLNMGYTSEGSRLRTFFTLFDILFEGLGEDALNDVIKHLGGGIYPDGLELEGGEDQELDVGASDKVRQITDVILYIYIFIACPMILVNMVIGYVIECKDALNETIKDHRVDMMVSLDIVIVSQFYIVFQLNQNIIDVLQLSTAYTTARLSEPIRRSMKRLGICQPPRRRPSALLFCLHRSGCNCDKSKKSLTEKQQDKIRILLHIEEGEFE